MITLNYTIDRLLTEEIDETSFQIIISDSSFVTVYPDKSREFSMLKFSDGREVMLDFYVPTYYFSQAELYDIPDMGRALVIDSGNSNIEKDMADISNISIVILSDRPKVFSCSTSISGIYGLEIKNNKLEVKIFQKEGIAEEREAFVVSYHPFVLEEDGFHNTVKEAKMYYYFVMEDRFEEYPHETCKALSAPFVENPEIRRRFL